MRSPPHPWLALLMTTIRYMMEYLMHSTGETIGLANKMKKGFTNKFKNTPAQFLLYKRGSEDIEEQVMVLINKL